MPFSPESLKFLFENHLRDSREWYAEHREDYKQYIVRPFFELVSELRPSMLKIDDQLLCEPNKAPRVFRDARIIKYTRDKSLFRDHVWCTFGRRRELYESTPAFYFQLSPEGFEYGCGYYKASNESIDALRTLILNDDPGFYAACKALERRPDYVMFGESYKRDRFPEQSRQKAEWLNRKSIGISATSHDSELLFSDRLADYLAESYLAAADFYHFLMKAEAVVRRTREGV